MEETAIRVNAMTMPTTVPKRPIRGPMLAKRLSQLILCWSLRFCSSVAPSAAITTASYPSSARAIAAPTMLVM